MIRHSVLPFLTLALLAFSTASASEVMLTRTQMQMGTLVSITLPKERAAWIQKGFERIRKVEMALSSYAPKAEVYGLNHGKRVTLSADTSEALRSCQRYHERTDGYFDITVGSITKKAYHFGEAEQLPDELELERAQIGEGAIVYDGREALLKKGFTIDLGGMGKGFAVDKVARLYRDVNITKGEIAASGDIRCLDICRIAVQDPFGEGVDASFTTRHPDTAISTSGNYRRFVKDKKHNHLIDPKQKRSQRHFASITLIGDLPNSDLDAYATAASVMPEKKAIAFLDSLPVGYLLFTTEGQRIEKRMSLYADMDPWDLCPYVTYVTDKTLNR